MGLLFFCILECKHYEHYDGHEITQRAAGAEVPRGCGRAGNHEALRYDADGGTYWYLWLILTNCVKGPLHLPSEISKDTSLMTQESTPPFQFKR